MVAITTVMRFDAFRDDVRRLLAGKGVPPHAITRDELIAAFSDDWSAEDAAEAFSEFWADKESDVPTGGWEMSSEQFDCQHSA